ncbi:MAG TPA: condensation domain-containing protein, partial [Pseudonocardiaceae bacterium]
MGTPERKRLPVGVVDRIPVSFNQDFLCMLDQGDDEGPFGPRYIVVCGWRVGGRIDTGTLHDALDELVVRHEALRTAIVRDDDQRYQQVLPPTRTELVEVDLADAVTEPDRERRIEELLIEIESGTHSVVHPPLLMAVLGRFTEQDSILVLVAHHTAADQWSLRLLIHDLAGEYAARRGFDVPEPTPVAQYSEYALWERTHAAEPAADRARAYWRGKLAGGTIRALPADHLRSENLPKNTSVYRFLIDQRLTSAVVALAGSASSSSFMVLLAAFKVFLYERTGDTDIVVPALMSGRGHARFHDTVGSFFNFVALRTELAGCGTFRELVGRTRRTCLEAYSHDIPFALVLAEVPEVGAPFSSDDLAVIGFQVFQFQAALDHERVG